MNKLFKTLSLLATIAFFASACVPPVVDVAQAAPAAPSYQVMLGKSVRDRDVADFIISNSCIPSGSFQLCKSAGLALRVDEDQFVETAYLYLDRYGDFAPYRGALPLALARQDTRTDVEHKLGQPKVEHAPQAGWELGLPDEGAV